jgi:hypothetical protein
VDTTPVPDGWIGLAEAAELLGISAEAVRQRVRRGTLRTRKESDGTVHVILPPEVADRTRTDDRTDGDGTTDQPLMAAHLDSLQREIEFLKAELLRREEAHREESRRKDHLLAAALERIPQIGAPQDAREAPQTASDGPGSGDDSQAPGEPQNGAQHGSWWRRFFGFE